MTAIEDGGERDREDRAASRKTLIALKQGEETQSSHARLFPDCDVTSSRGSLVCKAANQIIVSGGFHVPTTSSH